MWISIFAIAIAIAIFLSVAAVMMTVNSAKVKSILTKSPFSLDRRKRACAKLTPEETVREHNRGKKTAGEGRSRYWSEPWACPFESDEHYEERRGGLRAGL